MHHSRNSESMCLDRSPHDGWGECPSDGDSSPELRDMWKYGCPKSPVWSSGGDDWAGSEGTSSFEDYEHNVDNLALEAFPSTWTGCSFLAFIDFSSFFRQWFFPFFIAFFVPFCTSSFLPWFCFICLFFLTVFFPPFSKLFLFQLFFSWSPLAFLFFSEPFLFSTSSSSIYVLNSFVKTCHSFCFLLFLFSFSVFFFCLFSPVCSLFFCCLQTFLWTSSCQNRFLLSVSLFQVFFNSLFWSLWFFLGNNHRCLSSFLFLFLFFVHFFFISTQKTLLFFGTFGFLFLFLYLNNKLSPSSFSFFFLFFELSLLQNFFLQSLFWISFFFPFFSFFRFPFVHSSHSSPSPFLFVFPSFFFDITLFVSLFHFLSIFFSRPFFLHLCCFYLSPCCHDHPFFSISFSLFLPLRLFCFTSSTFRCLFFSLLFFSLPPFLSISYFRYLRCFQYLGFVMFLFSSTSFFSSFASVPFLFFLSFVSWSLLFFTIFFFLSFSFWVHLFFCAKKCSSTLFPLSLISFSIFELFLFVFFCGFVCFYRFFFFSFVFVFFRCLQLFFKKKMEISLPCFLVEKYVFANFLYGKLFQKMVPLWMFLKLCFLNLLFVFRCVLKKILTWFFLFSPSPSISSHFAFSVLSFSLFLDVLFNDPCLQEKTKKCFSLSISQVRNFSLKKKVSPLFGKIVFSSFLFAFVFLRMNVFVSFFNTSFCLPFFWTLSFCYFSTIHLFLSFDFQELRRRRRRRSVSKKKHNMCWCVCDYWQEGSLTLQRRMTGFAEKHFTSPTELWLQASPLHPPAPNSKYSTHAFPGTTCPGFHSFWLLPFPKLRSSHTRWAVHQTILRIRVRILTWRCTLRSLKGELHQQALDPFFDPFSCFFFVDFFHFCFIFVFEPSLFLTSGFFFLCTFVLSPPSSFESFSSYVMNFFLLGLFFFIFFSSPCFPFLKSFLFFSPKTC